MADWTRDDIARLLALLERIAAALEGRSATPPIGGTPSYPPASRSQVTRTAVGGGRDRALKTRRELGS
jgi:hypothetical protein